MLFVVLPLLGGVRERKGREERNATFMVALGLLCVVCKKMGMLYLMVMKVNSEFRNVLQAVVDG